MRNIACEPSMLFKRQASNLKISSSGGVVHIIYNTLCNWCLMVHNNNHIIQSGVLNKAFRVSLGLSFEVLESLVLW